MNRWPCQQSVSFVSMSNVDRVQVGKRRKNCSSVALVLNRKETIMKRTIRYLAALVFVAVVAAAGAAHANEEVLTPTNVGCFSSGECFIKVSPSVSASNSSCTDRSQVRFQMSSTGGESMFKTALSAQLAGKRLVINPSGCIGTFPSAFYLYLTN